MNKFRLTKPLEHVARSWQKDWEHYGGVSYDEWQELNQLVYKDIRPSSYDRVNRTKRRLITLLYPGIRELYLYWDRLGEQLEYQRGKTNQAISRHGEFSRLFLERGQFCKEDRVAVFGKEDNSDFQYQVKIGDYPVYNPKRGHKAYQISDLDFEFYFTDVENNVCAGGLWDKFLEGHIPKGGRGRAYIALYISTLVYRNPINLDKIVKWNCESNIKIYEENGENALAEAWKRDLERYGKLSLTEKISKGLLYCFIEPIEDEKPLVLKMAETILMSEWGLRDFDLDMDGKKIGLCVPRNYAFFRSWELGGIIGSIPVHRYKILTMMPHGYENQSQMYNDFELFYIESIKDAMRHGTNRVEFFSHIDDIESWETSIIPSLEDRLNVREIQV